jgi:DNA repair exonuclease SbcCD nuclease subunit
MAQLHAAGIPVYLVRGNHDAASQISRSLLPPPNVHQFATDHPQTYIIEPLRVALHGQGFKKREVTENLVPDFPPALPGYFNIGVLHTSLEGQSGHEPYAPCTIGDLVAKGYDYWALGHIHKRQVVQEQNPCIVYPGNLQGRHIRETGAKGCTVVRVDGSRIELEHRDLDVLRWGLCEVDLSGVETLEAMIARVAAEFQVQMEENPGYPLALRVRLVGSTALHGALLANSERYRLEIVNAAVLCSQEAGIWIEQVKFDTRSENQEPLGADHDDAIAELTRLIDETNLSEDTLSQFVIDMQAVQKRMQDYSRMEGATVISSAADIRPLMADARDMLLEMIVRGGRGQ